MSTESFSGGDLNIIGPEYYQQNGYPHREWTYLRRHQPVYRYEGRARNSSGRLRSTSTSYRSPNNRSCSRIDLA
jgi:hypothetical protein